MKERSDSEWVEGIRSKDPETLADLWKQIRSWVKAKLKGELKKNDYIDEATDAAYWQIIDRGVGNYRFNGRFLHFCQVISIRKALAVARKENRKPPQHPIDDLSIGEQMDMDPLANASQIYKRLKPCLDLLKPRDRDILLQISYLGEEPQVLADKYGITRTYVNKISFDTRRKVRKCLQDRGYTDRGDIQSL